MKKFFNAIRRKVPASYDMRLYIGAGIVAGGIEYGHVSIIFIGAVVILDSIAEAFIGYKR